MIGSDHAPYTLSEKSSAEMISFETFDGMPGLELSIKNTASGVSRVVYL